MVAPASTVTAAFARKLHAAFACKGSDYGSGGSGGGSPARVVIGCDCAVDRGAGGYLVYDPGVLIDEILGFR